ncbi:leucine-rich repeat domain-containing protein [Flavobacterium notoginsengisoli]|uniref:leucine-rich repeat domain-containing protein n=1 Tax=Flavobacterium notoginsengisoli TaxID=1478199 RepID=UPI0036404C54
MDEALKNPENCKKLSLMSYNQNLKDKGEIFSKFINLEILEIQAETSIYYLDDFELPAVIGNLKKLKKISVLNFPLKTFPEWIFEIESLQYLMLRGTDITEIPDLISRLKKLKTLRIENCPLNKIPRTLSLLKNLKILGLSDTRLTNLTWNLFPSNLKEINFCGTGIYKKEDLEYLKTKLPKTKIFP